MSQEFTTQPRKDSAMHLLKDLIMNEYRSDCWKPVAMAFAFGFMYVRNGLKAGQAK